MSDMKKYEGSIFRGYRYRIVGGGSEWFGEVVNVPQVTSVRGKSKYAVKSLLRRGIREYVWTCDDCGVIPQRSCATVELLRHIDVDGVCSEEMVSLYTLLCNYGVVFTDVIWLFSNENFVIKRRMLEKVVLDAKDVGGERLALFINISNFGGECSISRQPYPDFFSVSIDNTRGVMEVHFFDIEEHRERYCFDVNIETPSGLKVDAVNVFRSGDGRNSVFYGYTTLSRERFFSFNI